MTERMDILSVRTYTKNGETRNAYTRIGTAWATSKGGWSLVFEALPIAQAGKDGKIETRALMVPPNDDKGNSEPKTSSAPAFEGGAYGDPGDDIPFLPERRG